MTDLRSPLAKARDKFLESDEGVRAADPISLKAPSEMRQYLRNRIENAFVRGWEAGQKAPRSTPRRGESL